MTWGDLSGVWQIACAVAMAGAVYGRIRQDLKSIHRQMGGHPKCIMRLHRRLEVIGAGNK